MPRKKYSKKLLSIEEQDKFFHQLSEEQQHELRERLLKKKFFQRMFERGKMGARADNNYAAVLLFQAMQQNDTKLMDKQIKNLIPIQMLFQKAIYRKF